MQPTDSTTTSISLSPAEWPGHVKSWITGWPEWWRALSPRDKVLPAALVALYWISLFAVGGFRGDHLQMGLLLLALSYGGRPTRVLLRFLMPLLLTAIIYDSQRFYSDYIRGPIHVEQPYWFDKTIFGIKTAQGVLTPNEWWQLHTHPVLDFISGFFYLAFIGIFVLFSAWYYFWLSRTGTKKYPAARIRLEAPRLMWAFLWLNLLGYSTYYWYAAAPPWYVALYGLGPANMSALPNPAGCLRFDQLLGTHFFTGMYGRSADVFGAIPSLHIAYPLLAVYYAFRLGAGRAFAVCFYLVMCFSAVYLNHHYVLDLIWGSCYALLIGVITDRVSERMIAKRSVTL